MASDVMFRRVRGRIVPIRRKGSKGKSAPRNVTNVNVEVELPGNKGGSRGGAVLTSGLGAGTATHLFIKKYEQGFQGAQPKFLKDVVPDSLARKGIGARQAQLDRIVKKLDQRPAPKVPLKGGTLFDQAKDIASSKRTEALYETAQQRLQRFRIIQHQNAAILKSLRRFRPYAAVGVGIFAGAAAFTGSNVFGGGGGGE